MDKLLDYVAVHGKPWHATATYWIGLTLASFLLQAIMAAAGIPWYAAILLACFIYALIIISWTALEVRDWIKKRDEALAKSPWDES